MKLDKRKLRSPALTGTTLDVYRFLYKTGKPTGIRDIQRGLSLSSPSVAEYHVRKLLSAGLVKELESKYVVDRIVFENMIRIRTSTIPLQVAYVVFFGLSLALLLTVFREQTPSMAYLFSVLVMIATCIIFSLQAIRTFISSTI